MGDDSAAFRRRSRHSGKEDATCTQVSQASGCLRFKSTFPSILPLVGHISIRPSAGGGETSRRLRAVQGGHVSIRSTHHGEVRHPDACILSARGGVSIRSIQQREVRLMSLSLIRFSSSSFNPLPSLKGGEAREVRHLVVGGGRFNPLPSLKGGEANDLIDRLKVMGWFQSAPFAEGR
jgi:hypothetical protein